MINLESINKNKDISAEQMLGINRFEEQFVNFLKKILQQEKFAHLKVLPSFSLIYRDKKTSQLTHDASLSKKGSLELINIIVDWIRDYDELEVYIQKFTLIIDLKIVVSEIEKNSEKPDEGLPVFTPTRPRYTLDKVILPEETKKRIVDDLSIISKTDLIYKTWGFEEIDGIPRLVLSLYGKPGTGKTMLAHAIADHFGKQLLALNYSEIESKYVGDAAKNLKHAFDTAKKLDAVLFFDEADSFLGKRIQNVSQGAEQAINSLRSQMLILLEEHEGVVIFATNLVANFDKAFESRFLDSIEIPMPNLEARATIIKGMIPQKLPLQCKLTDEDFLKASELVEGLAGREIKNAILKMLLAKADNPSYAFSSEDICEAMRRKKAELDDLHKEIDGQNGKINATPEQLDKVKDAIKDSMDNAPVVKLDQYNKN